MTPQSRRPFPGQNTERFDTMRTIVCCIFMLVCATQARLSFDQWSHLVEEEIRALRDVEAPHEDLPTGCYPVADFGLVIDSSRSIHKDDFKRGQEFLANFAEIFKIGPDNVRFSAITFSDGIHKEDAFEFNTHLEKTDLVSTIRSIPFRAGGYTSTGEGIEFMRDELMKKARDDVPRFGIVITDGNSQEHQKTEQEAHKAKENGIIMIAIGVGKVDEAELERIASGDNFILRASNYSDLQNIRAALITLTCRELTTPAPKTEPCGLKSPADVYFLYDERQLGANGIGDVGEFISYVVDKQNFEGMNYGAISVCDSKNGFDLKAWNFRELEPVHFDRAYQTSASRLLNILNEDVTFSEERGHRQEARKIAVLFVDGKLGDLEKAKEEAAAALSQDVELFVVNMGGESKFAQGLVDDKYYIDAAGSFDGANEFIHRICSGVEHILDWEQ